MEPKPGKGGGGEEEGEGGGGERESEKVYRHNHRNCCNWNSLNLLDCYFNKKELSEKREKTEENLICLWKPIGEVSI